MIAVIDYGLGNLRSVAGAVEKVGHDPIITNSRVDLENADKLILPGVGAFRDGMANLHDLGLIEILTDLVISEGKPILGICLGSHLMAREGYEFGRHKGLGWIDASVIRIDACGTDLRVPHVGWNELIKIKESLLFDGIPDDALFYYVHSFHVECDDPEVVIGQCEYGVTITAAFQKDNIYATQFHPEKSQLDGLRLLKNFLDNA